MRTEVTFIERLKTFVTCPDCKEEREVPFAYKDELCSKCKQLRIINDAMQIAGHEQKVFTNATITFTLHNTATVNTGTAAYRTHIDITTALGSKFEAFLDYDAVTECDYIRLQRCERDKQ